MKLYKVILLEIGLMQSKVYAEKICEHEWECMQYINDTINEYTGNKVLIEHVYDFNICDVSETCIYR